MQKYYAPDALVMKMMTGDTKVMAAHWIFYESEAQDEYYGVLHEIEWIVRTIQNTLAINGNIYFAVSVSLNPFQVAHIEADDFCILIDHRAFYYLLTLCLRLQSLLPASKELGFIAIPEPKDYHSKYLLDITKDIVFHTPDISPLLVNMNNRAVYQAALTYIICHEIAHISHGHLEFCSSTYFCSLSQNDQDKNLTLRTLEMDADSSATSLVFDIFERFSHNQSVFPEGMNNEDFITNIRKQYLFGISIAHIYLDTLTSNFFPQAHPISYARFLTSSGVMALIYSTRAPEAIPQIEHMRKILVEVFIHLSGDIKYLGYPIATNITIYGDDFDNPDYLYDHQFGVASGLSHLEPLYSRWSRIRPYLKLFQRGGVLAPAQAEPI